MGCMLQCIQVKFDRMKGGLMEYGCSLAAKKMNRCGKTARRLITPQMLESVVDLREGSDSGS